MLLHANKQHITKHSSACLLHCLSPS